MKKLTAAQHQNLYFLGLALVMAGMPLSKVIISIGQMLLLGNWLLEGGIPAKLKQFWNNKAAVIISSIFLLHVVGLLFTGDDFDYAWKDLRNKIPLLLLPLIISSSPPLKRERFSWLMSVFVAAVLISTIFSTYIFLGFKGVDGKDIRDISIFGSHIRFGLLICIAIFSLLHFLVQKDGQPYQTKMVQLGLILWLGLFILILESMTAIVILLAVAYLIVMVLSFRQSKIWIKVAASIVLIGIPLSVGAYLLREVNRFYDVAPIDYSTLEKKAPSGETYKHFPERKNLENGHYVWVYVAWKEMDKSWNERSELKFWGEDHKGQPLHSTLVRFLASKGLRKDASGVNALSEDEIKAVENGMANVRFIGSWSIKNRIYQIIWEFDSYSKGSNPGGNSVTQRIEFFKAACGILSNNWLTGVGTGDVKYAYAQHYEETNSLLEKKYRLRAHNQYLTMAVAFGIPGMIWFFWALIHPVFLAGKSRDFLFLTFYLVALLSMINEDTLETQVGVTLFSFFTCILLFGRENDFLRKGENRD